MDLEQVLARDADALDGLRAFLTWRDIQRLEHSCSAAWRLRAQSKWHRHTRVVLPPTPDACHGLTYNNIVRCVTIAHTQCLEALATGQRAWLEGVEQLTLDVDRFVLPPPLASAPLDFSAIATVIPQLTELNLSSAKAVVDITPLTQLTNLRRLNLSSTGVRDLSPLASLERLQHLNITDTRVVTFAPLRDLPNLNTLVLNVSAADCASLVSIASWPHPPLLRVVNVRGGGDVDALEQSLLIIAPLLAELTCQDFRFRWRSAENGYEERSALFTAMRRVETLAVSNALLLYRLDMLASLTTLRVLRVSTLRSSDISPLSTLQALEDISLTSDKCLDLSPLASLPRLRSLYCHGGDPDSMSQDIQLELRTLQALDASNHYLQCLCRLERLDELRVYVWSGDSLMLPSSCAAQLTKLRLNGDVSLREIHDRFPRLRALELQQCVRYNADDLAQFSALESLTLLDPFSSYVLPSDVVMPRLRRLCLRGLNVNTVTMNLLSTVPNLQELVLERTNVHDIASLTTLQKLEVLNLKDTLVRDVMPLLSIPSLVTVMLPKRTRCTPLVDSYHDSSNRSRLREVLHPTRNCLWGPHKRQQPRTRDPSDATSESKGDRPQRSLVSELTEALDRCSIA